VLVMSSIEEDLEYDTLPVGEKYRQLVVADRCDRCGAQAMVRAHKQSYELLFCRHHGYEHFDALTDQEFMFQDESSRILDISYSDED